MPSQHPLPSSPLLPSPRRLRPALFVAASLVAGAFVAPGCSVGFPVASKLSSVRVLSVEIDKPYAQPGDTVTLDLTALDARESPSAALDIRWLPPCINPPGDQYFACFEQFLAPPPGVGGGGGGAGGSGELPPDFDPSPFLDLLPKGTSFSFEIPADILTSRPRPAGGPHYGLAYVFALVCGGADVVFDLEPPEQTGAAGYFPFVCVDAEGNNLGSPAFVVTYTQVYVFEDGRTNDNPAPDRLAVYSQPPEGSEAKVGSEIDWKLDGDIPVVRACDVTEVDRRKPVTCSAPDPFEVCEPYRIGPVIQDIELVSEFDEGATTADGTRYRESVWISYFSEEGDFDPGIKLVADPIEGLLDTVPTDWLAPPNPGLVRLWGVMRDNRGGSKLLAQDVCVADPDGSTATCEAELSPP